MLYINEKGRIYNENKETNSCNVIGGMILCSNMEVLAVQQNEIEVNNCIASQEVAVEKYKKMML